VSPAKKRSTIGPRSVPALTAPVRARKLASVEHTTEAGLDVIAVRKPGVPLIELRLRIPFLSPKRDHPAQATLLSDTILTGADGMDRNELASRIQGLGADISVGVDADLLHISGSMMATNLVPVLELLAKVLTTASYPRAEVAVERERLVERLTMARSQAGVIAREALATRMFGDHPYARELPDAAAAHATTPGALRRLHDWFVVPEGSTLVLVGDLSPARVMEQVENALGDWNGSKSVARMPALPPIVRGPLTLVDRPGSVQSSLRMGGPALRRSDDGYAALQLANLIFGGYFSSRWTENIREDKGYTYGPHSRIDHGALGSVLIFDTDVRTEVTGPALLETVYELGKIASLPPTETEIESVRQYAIGSLALSTATQAGLASNIAGLVSSGVGLEWLAEHPARLAKVTTEEISAAAHKFFAPSALVTVVVGDANVVRSQLEALTDVLDSGEPAQVSD
jgi:zinc protease